MRGAWLLPLILLIACGSDPDPSSRSSEPAPGVGSAADRDPADPDRLRTPFTAEQIRSEWVEGLELTIHFEGPEGPSLQRWTVVGADADGVDIAYEGLDPSGAPEGQPVIERATWSQLRDHASYPAGQASRQRARRESGLGALDGWLYTVRDEEAGTVTELFFADRLPGPPVEMVTRRGDEQLARMRQTAREVRPPAP